MNVLAVGVPSGAVAFVAVMLPFVLSQSGCSNSRERVAKLIRAASWSARTRAALLE